MLSTGEAKALLKAVAEVVREHVQAAYSGIVQRLAAIEERLAAPAEPGPKGDRGDAGESVTGLSAYEIAVDRGFVGDVDTWLLSLHGKPGEAIKGDSGQDARIDEGLLEGLVAAAVEKAIAQMPEPKKGEDGKSVTVDDVAPVIKREVAAAVAQIPSPAAGKDADPVVVEEMVQAAVAKAAAEIPRPPGPEYVDAAVAKAVAALPVPADGKDADPAQIRAEVAKAVAALPVPKDGTSVTAEDVLPALQKTLQAAIDAMPLPANGKDGTDGTSVTIDDVGSVLQEMQARWALDFERRAQDVLQRTIDRMPVPKDGRDGINGKDGRDALDLEDLDLTHDGEGNVTFRFVRGDLKKEFSLRFPVFLDRGIFKADQQYRCGNVVSFGNSMWMAQKDDPEGKPGLSPDWRLAVRAGRDGRQGDKGDAGKNGTNGKDGRDLTSFGHIAN